MTQFSSLEKKKRFQNAQTKVVADKCSQVVVDTTAHVVPQIGLAHPNTPSNHSSSVSNRLKKKTNDMQAF